MAGVGGGATSTLPGTEEPSVIIQKTKGGKDKIPMQGAEFSFLFEPKAKDGEKNFEAILCIELYRKIWCIRGRGKF